MGKSSEYKYYMQRTDISGQSAIDIENYFGNIRYLKAEGMNSVGKSKNIYTETYADSDRLRVYLPPDGEYTNEATTITMTFLVVGDAVTRQSTLDEFLSYIREGVHKYWDTARNREFEFIVIDEIKVSDEKWHGSQPYVEVQIPMQNLNGKTVLRQTNS